MRMYRWGRESGGRKKFPSVWMCACFFFKKTVLQWILILVILVLETNYDAQLLWWQGRWKISKRFTPLQCSIAITARLSEIPFFQLVCCCSGTKRERESIMVCLLSTQERQKEVQNSYAIGGPIKDSKGGKLQWMVHKQPFFSATNWHVHLWLFILRRAAPVPFQIGIGNCNIT